MGRPRESVAVRDRATELLLRQISWSELCFFKEHGYFFVRAKRYQYRIYPRKEANIQMYDGPYRVGWYDSSYQDEDIPLADQIVSQYVLLKTDEANYVGSHQCVLVKRG